MKTNTVPSYWVQIHIAGNIDLIKSICKEWCTKNIICVTVTPTDYIYDGGSESGATVRFINYPKRPTDSQILAEKAIELARLLREKCDQKSFTIEDSQLNYWEEKE